MARIGMPRREDSVHPADSLSYGCHGYDNESTGLIESAVRGGRFGASGGEIPPTGRLVRGPGGEFLLAGDAISLTGKHVSLMVGDFRQAGSEISPTGRLVRAPGSDFLLTDDAILLTGKHVSLMVGDFRRAGDEISATGSLVRAPGAISC
jgi:hypothetical protein